jgi:butyryl-CoA dehydrogenase
MPKSDLKGVCSQKKIHILRQWRFYSEGGFALGLWASQLVDDEKTAETEEARAHAHTLLDFITPILKAWPSEFCLKANHDAIQVLGGHGYVNEHPVEMLYRDNRLNAIHEGTTGIQSLYLLGRKVPLNNFAGYRALLGEMNQTIEIARSVASLTQQAQALAEAVSVVQETTDKVLSAVPSVGADAAFSNSVHYLNMFGHVVVAWMWLRQGMCAQKSLGSDPHQADHNFYQGKLQTMRYFSPSSYPKFKTGQSLWLPLIYRRMTCKRNGFDHSPHWFGKPNKAFP